MRTYFASYFLLFAVHSVLLTSARAQDALVAPATDSLKPPINSKIFNLLVTQTFLTNGTGVDSMPLRGTASGSFFIGGGFIIQLIPQKLGLRLTPGYAAYRLTYERTSFKRFPTASDSLTLERHTLGFAEAPFGIFYNFKNQPNGNPEIFAELGGFLGYRLNASYKTRRLNELGQEVTTVVKNIGDAERLRYGVYARLGYKWVALHTSFRFSNLWLSPGKEREGFQYPRVPGMEVGLTLFL